MTTDDILKKATKNWKVVEHYGDILVGGDDVGDVAEFYDKTNAEIAVRAVNSFEAMREALQWYAEYAGTTAINYDFGKVAQKALALAEKEGE